MCMKESAFRHTEGTKEDKDVLMHFGFFLMTLLLIGGFLGGYTLEVKQFHYLHEAGGHLLIGVVAGLFLLIFFGQQHIEHLHGGLADQIALATQEAAAGSATPLPTQPTVAGLAMEELDEEAERSELINVAQFNDDFFFLFLLPPIIFEAGYNMHRRKFFANIGAVCVYAFVGTVVSAAIIAAAVYGAGQLGSVFSATADGEGFSVLESLIFGSLISATDPVTVLAIFGSMGADLDLYSLVFGESVLNDAVAIVLYRTLDIFNPKKCKATGRCEVTQATVVNAFGEFSRIFVGSILIGTIVALSSALLYKHTSMYKPEFESLEVVLLILFPYMAWMLAEAMQLSGIVAILFCGIVMAHYTTHNLHPRTEVFSRRFFKTVAFGCESFVFIYMGLAMFTFEQDWGIWPITLVAILAMLLSRAFNVVPNTWLVNWLRPAEKQIKTDFVKIMWFSGLRGAIAFALALKSAVDYDVRGSEPGAPAGAGPAILTMTLLIVLFTVLSMGGAITDVLKHYDAFESTAVLADVSNDKVMMEGREHSNALKLDRAVLKPLFTWRYQRGTDAGRDPRWSAGNHSGLEAGALGGHGGMGGAMRMKARTHSTQRLSELVVMKGKGKGGRKKDKSEAQDQMEQREREREGLLSARLDTPREHGAP